MHCNRRGYTNLGECPPPYCTVAEFEVLFLKIFELFIFMRYYIGMQITFPVSLVIRVIKNKKCLVCFSSLHIVILAQNVLMLSYNQNVLYIVMPLLYHNYKLWTQRGLTSVSDPRHSNFGSFLSFRKFSINLVSCHPPCAFSTVE